MKRALVTGATGFIGRFLVRELLCNEVEVIAVVREGSTNACIIDDLDIQIVECDLSDIASLSELVPNKDIDTVFHIAWQGVSGPDTRNQKVQMQNIASTLDLVDVCHELGVSTFVGCGSIHEPEAISEMAQDKRVSNMGMMYKTAKTAAHWMAKAKCGEYGIRFFWPLINTYGEEETSARLINTVIRSIFDGVSPALSSGEQYYDFVHVADVARALFLIAEKGIDGTNYVIGSNDAKPLKDFLVEVGEVANALNNGSDIPLGFGQIKSNVIMLPKDSFDSTSLMQDTGFTITVPFSEGIRRTAEWIKHQRLS